MKAQVNKDSKYLVANKEHKNFTESEEKVEEGTILNGEPRNVEGLRRGKPFTYRLFITNDKKILYINNITPMQTTEVMLGADKSQTPTLVNLTPAEMFNKTKTMGLIIGGLAGFAWAKYKQKDMKKVAMYIGVGALIGYGSAFIVDRNRKATVTPSK